jgi:predicted RNase H-like nuclease (RuvC/YqgF family)
LRYTLTKTETTLTTPLKVKITRNEEEEEEDDFINEQILLPHDKNSINFLINEYLLQQNYKMTSVTFSEENESLNLEDWDEIGLNKAKPPSIINLFKSTTSKIVTKDQLLSKRDFSQQINFDENLIDIKIEEIEKLNEKQKLLLNKIEEMSLEIENLNGEREILIKRIESKIKEKETIEYEKFKFER